MKTSIINYLDDVIKALSSDLARIERPFDYVILRTKIDVLNDIRATFDKHLPDEAEPPAPAALEQVEVTPVEAEIV